ncbi:hypothetical protein [Neobacillus cucumis]|nr:hypothetical protein [Neobacillus cucumis]
MHINLCDDLEGCYRMAAFYHGTPFANEPKELGINTHILTK